MLKAIWIDETGVIISTELVLLLTILVIGMIVGLTTLRDSLATEFADIGQSISNMNQSFNYSGVQGHGAFTSGGTFSDLLDFCDAATTTSAQTSKCVVVNVPAQPEAGT